MNTNTRNGKDSLGTSWLFTVYEATGPRVTYKKTYGVNVGVMCVLPKYANKEFRIAPDDHDRSKWRIDYADVIIWCALNGTQYDSPEAAAAALIEIVKA